MSPRLDPKVAQAVEDTISHPKVRIAFYDSICSLGCKIAEGENIVKIDGDWWHAECAESEGAELDWST